MLRTTRTLLVTALLLCLTVLPTMAQDTTATPADASGATGITTLIILAGLGAILVVGGVIYMREKNREVD